MPLDVTHKVLTIPDRLQAFRDLGTLAGRSVAGMLDFYDRWDMEKYGTDGGPLHDPTVVAYLIDPDMFGGKQVNVEIVFDSGPAQGMTIVDWWGVTGKEPNALVINEVDANHFFDLLVERIARL
jgi:purine nucleosidase